MVIIPHSQHLSSNVLFFFKKKRWACHLGKFFGRFISPVLARTIGLLALREEPGPFTNSDPLNHIRCPVFQYLTSFFGIWIFESGHVGRSHRALRSICADVVGVEVLGTADIQPCATDDRMCEVGVGRLSFEVEAADHLEALRCDGQQGHRVLAVQGADHPVGAGYADLAHRLIELDGLAC